MMIFKIINFLIFAGTLVFFLRRPVRKFLSERSSSIRSVVESSQKSVEAALKMDAEITKKLADVQAEIERLRSGVLSRARAEKEAALKSARLYSDKLKKDIEALISQEVSKMKSDIASEVLAGAVLLATTKIKERFSESEHLDMAKKGLDCIERTL